MTITEQIEALDAMTTAELAAEYERVHGRPARYRNPIWLRKRIAYQLQVAEFGGLPIPAREELARLMGEIRLPSHRAESPTADTGDAPRPGTVLQRDWKGKRVRVLVTDDGFEWNGEVYGSLSAAARAITNSRWNGRVFFGLAGRSGS